MGPGVDTNASQIPAHSILRCSVIAEYSNLALHEKPEEAPQAALFNARPGKGTESLTYHWLVVPSRCRGARAISVWPFRAGLWSSTPIDAWHPYTHACTARWQQLPPTSPSLRNAPRGDFVQRCSPSEKPQTFTAFAWPQPRARLRQRRNCPRLVLFVDLGLDRRPNRLLQHGRVDAELIEQRRLQAPRLQADGARSPERGAAPRP
jgi:hypothetical protein